MNTYNNRRFQDSSCRFQVASCSRRLLAKGLLGIICLMASLCFTSCSDDVIDAEADAAAKADVLTRGYSNDQIKLQRLGYAYNAAGSVMDDKYFSTSPIVDMDRLRSYEASLGLIINSERRHYTSMDIFSGNTLEEMGHSETKYTIDETGAIATGKYYRENNVFSRTTWHNSYKAHMFIKHIMATMTMDVGMLQCLNLDDLDNNNSILAEDFRMAVKQLVAKTENGITEAVATEFSEKYGTHLVVSSNLGGMIELMMQIERDSCVDKSYTINQVTQTLFGKDVVTTSPPSKVVERLVKYDVQYEGEIKVKGGDSEDCAKLHRTFDQKKAAEVKISEGDYYGWANRISIEPESYNASFVSGRFLPYYQLFEDITTRKVMRKVFETYLKKEAPTKEPYEAPYGTIPVEGNYGQDVRVIYNGIDKACIICKEYVPSIRSDSTCIVAYPLIKGSDGNMRPYLYSGLFVGDESHRPGRVIWQGSASAYIPNDSIHAESDTLRIRNLFDPKTKRLKNLYFYWGAVQPAPCSTKNEQPLDYQSVVFTEQPSVVADPMNFAKVASTFWSVKPVRLKNDNMRTYWEKDSAFVQFTRDRYKEYNGTLYKNSAGYWFALIDGGDHIKRAGEHTGDVDGHLRWTEAVSNSVKAIGLGDYLPSVMESQSITKMLGNRMSIFYERQTNGRNLLGLDWPTGYWVLSHPNQQTMAITWQQNDASGFPVVTSDEGEARIMRVSASGTDLLLDYPEYVSAFNYSSQEFFKFFPIYITINNFGK